MAATSSAGSLVSMVFTLRGVALKISRRLSIQRILQSSPDSRLTTAAPTWPAPNTAMLKSLPSTGSKNTPSFTAAAPPCSRPRASSTTAGSQATSSIPNTSAAETTNFIVVSVAVTSTDGCR